MELNQADKQVLVHFFGEEKVNQLSGALISDDGELSLGLSTGGKRLMSQNEIDTATTANQDAYIEVGYKKIAKELGIDLQAGEKDPKVIADRLKVGLTNSLEEKYKSRTPSEEYEAAQNKIKELETKYNTLHGTYEQTKSNVEEWEGKYTGLQTEIKTKEHNNIILKSLPEKAKVNKDHAVLIINNVLEKEDNNGVTMYKDQSGKHYLDPIGNPLELKDIVPTLAEEFGWVKGAGMNGGDRNSKGDGKAMFQDTDQAMKYMSEKGIEPMSNEGLKIIAEQVEQ